MSWFGNTGRQPAPEKKALNIDADQTNTNQQAIPVPYLAGRRRVSLIFGAPVYDQVNEEVKTKVGKGDSQTVGYIYYGDIFGLICMGGRVALAKIWKYIIDSEIAWRNDAGMALSTSSGNAVSIENYGPTWVYAGSATQPTDTHVLTPTGALPGGADPRDTTTWGGAGPSSGHPNEIH